MHSDELHLKSYVPKSTISKLMDTSDIAQKVKDRICLLLKQ
jgi:hypothetical protein